MDLWLFLASSLMDLDMQLWQVIGASTDTTRVLEYTAADTLWDLAHLGREAAHGMQITLPTPGSYL